MSNCQPVGPPGLALLAPVLMAMEPVRGEETRCWLQLGPVSDGGSLVLEDRQDLAETETADLKSHRRREAADPQQAARGDGVRLRFHQNPDSGGVDVGYFAEVYQDVALLVHQAADVRPQLVKSWSHCQMTGRLKDGYRSAFFPTNIE